MRVMLNSTQDGKGHPIVLLHGMAGSLRYWNPVIPLLSERHRVIALDLLGFGQSPKPKTDYTADNHVREICRSLDALAVDEPVTLVGHSMGGLIALRLAVRQPERVHRLVLISMPLYRNPEEAKAAITGGRPLLRWIYYGLSSRMLCFLWCRLLRPLSRRVAPLYLRRLHRAAAEDSVLHTWRSYDSSRRNVLEEMRVEEELAALRVPAILLYGVMDDPVTLHNLSHLRGSSNVEVLIREGGHDLPLGQPELVARLVTDQP